MLILKLVPNIFNLKKNPNPGTSAKNRRYYFVDKIRSRRRRATALNSPVLGRDFLCVSAVMLTMKPRAGRFSNCSCFKTGWYQKRRDWVGVTVKVQQWTHPRSSSFGLLELTTCFILYNPKGTNELVNLLGQCLLSSHLWLLLKECELQVVSPWLHFSDVEFLSFYIFILLSLTETV